MQRPALIVPVKGLLDKRRRQGVQKRAALAPSNSAAISFVDNAAYSDFENDARRRGLPTIA
jgi:hypothetical protein